MPNWLLVCGDGIGSTVLKAVTTYYQPMSWLAADTTEARFQALARDTYTLSQLYVRVIANSVTAASTVRSRKDTANGGQSVSITASTTGVFQDTSGSDSLVDGSLFNTQIVTGATGTSLTITLIGYQLTTSSNTTPIIMGNDGATHLPANDYYVPFAGCCVHSSTETGTQYTIRTATTLSNFRIYVRANTASFSITYRVRVNSGQGNETFSVGAGLTGSFEDAVNTDSVTAGQPVGYRYTAGAGTGSLFPSTYQIKSTSTGRQAVASQVAGDVLAKGLTRYLPIEGNSTQFASVEANTQIATPFAFIGKNLFVRIITNNINNSTTVRTRKNTANGAMSVSIGASATGAFEDTTNFDSLIATHLYNYQIVTGGTSGTLVLGIIGFELAQVAVSRYGFVNFQDPGIL